MTNVWILNHYATRQYTQRGGRHYWFSKKLVERGYSVTIYAASTVHGPHRTEQLHGRDSLEGVTYEFLNSPRYKTGPGRIWNILVYFVRLLQLKHRHEQPPDVIYASSVHPLTLLAGIKLAKHFGVPCICEVRDLWPLSIEVYVPSTRGSLMTRAMYAGEHWLYRHADQLIFTMPGGARYIEDRGWEKTVDRRKIHYINNGVDLATFDSHSSTELVNDSNIPGSEIFKVVYAGSIRKVNKIDTLVEVASELHRRSISDVKLIIYGDGDQRKDLERAAVNIPTISFEGAVTKAEVPNLLRQADALIFHADQGLIARYGTSMNKLFEYLASGTPIISNCKFGYDPIEANNCGFVVPNGSPRDLADAIQHTMSLPLAEYNEIARRARAAALDYDFEALTDKLESVINQAITDQGN